MWHHIQTYLCQNFGIISLHKWATALIEYSWSVWYTYPCSRPHCCSRSQTNNRWAASSHPIGQSACIQLYSPAQGQSVGASSAEMSLSGRWQEFSAFMPRPCPFELLLMSSPHMVVCASIIGALQWNKTRLRLLQSALIDHAESLWRPTQALCFINVTGAFLCTYLLHFLHKPGTMGSQKSCWIAADFPQPPLPAHQRIRRWWWSCCEEHLRSISTRVPPVLCMESSNFSKNSRMFGRFHSYHKPPRMTFLFLIAAGSSFIAICMGHIDELDGL